jgi:hypothetical protein
VLSLSLSLKSIIVPRISSFKIVLNLSTFKPLYNDHPWDPKIVVVVDRWSLLKGHLCNKSSKCDLIMVVVIDRWSLFGGGR